jgi:hypothetical protein
MKTEGIAPLVLASQLDGELKRKGLNSLYYTNTHMEERGGCDESFAALKVRHSVKCRNF